MLLTALLPNPYATPWRQTRPVAIRSGRSDTEGVTWEAANTTLNIDNLASQVWRRTRLTVLSSPDPLSWRSGGLRPSAADASTSAPTSTSTCTCACSPHARREATYLWCCVAAKGCLSTRRLFAGVRALPAASQWGTGQRPCPGALQLRLERPSRDQQMKCVLRCHLMWRRSNSIEPGFWGRALAHYLYVLKPMSLPSHQHIPPFQLSASSRPTNSTEYVPQQRRCAFTGTPLTRVLTTSAHVCGGWQRTHRCAARLSWTRQEMVGGGQAHCPFTTSLIYSLRYQQLTAMPPTPAQENTCAILSTRPPPRAAGRTAHTRTGACTAARCGP
jgi:hypothetical protein